MVRLLRDGQRVRVNLAGLRVGSVVFHAPVTDAVGTIVSQVSEDPPAYLVKLLFPFRGVDEIGVPQDRIVAESTHRNGELLRFESRSRELLADSADLRPLGTLWTKFCSQCREQARRA
jgi:hypothetical protein